MGLSQSAKQLLVSQASIALFALAAGTFGRTGWRYWLFVLAYFVVFAVVMQRFLGPGREIMGKVEEVESGKVLFQEKECFKIMAEDAEYQREAATQMKLLQANLVLFLPVLFYFAIAYHPVISTVPHFFESRWLGLVASYFLLFEGSFAISKVAQWYFEHRIAKAGARSLQISVPKAFTVTSKGVVLHGLASKSAVKFPIEGYEIRYSVPRRFVELYKDTGKALVIIRLYTREPEKLYNIIVRKNRQAKEAAERERREEGE